MRNIEEKEKIKRILQERISIPPPKDSILEKDCLIERNGEISVYCGGRETRLYRIVYILEYGEIPKSHHIGHFCERKQCSEISHLYLKEGKKGKKGKERKDLEIKEIEDLKQVEVETQEFLKSLKS